MHNWSIPTSQLTGPRKLGGRVSRRGFAFQDAYACLQLSYLLDSTQGLVAIRPEGAQDVDLLYSDGCEEYVQLKHEPDEHYTLVALRTILQAFALDLLEAGRPTTLTFVLVVLIPLLPDFEMGNPPKRTLLRLQICFPKAPKILRPLDVL